MNNPQTSPSTRLNASEVLKKLQDGNERFVSGVVSVESMLGIHKLRGLTKAQAPYCVVVCCSDSRAPVETIFDCGIGEVFVIRVPGNIVSNDVVAGLEFAAGAFAPSLCVVMGHSSCGVFTAAVESELGRREPGAPSFERFLSRVRPMARETIKANPADAPEQWMHQACSENVRRGLRTFTDESPVLRKLVEDRQMEIRGAIYDLSTGRVEFMPADATSGLRPQASV